MAEKRWALILLVPAVSLLLTSCAPIAAIVGYSQTVIESAAVIDRASLVADGALLASTGKTLSDHALSELTGADCKVIKVVSGAPVCVPKKSESNPPNKKESQNTATCD